MLTHTCYISLQYALSVLSPLWLHQSLLGNGCQCRRFFNFRVHVRIGWLLSHDWTLLTWPEVLLVQPPIGPDRKIPSSHNFSIVACLPVASITRFDIHGRETLPSNGCLFWFCYPCLRHTCHNILLPGIPWLEADAIKTGSDFLRYREMYIWNSSIKRRCNLSLYSCFTLGSAEVFKHFTKAFMSYFLNVTTREDMTWYFYVTFKEHEDVQWLLEIKIKENIGTKHMEYHL
jgi:hypothetical protein